MRDIKIHPMSYETMTTLTNFATVSTSQDFESKHLCYTTCHHETQ